MTDREAQEILNMIEAEWGTTLGGRVRTHWAHVFMGFDAEIVTKAVARIAAEKQGRRPTLPEFREVIAMLSRNQPKPVCSTCGGDRMVPVGTRPVQQTPWMKAKGIELPDRGGQDEAIPCPDCNPNADVSFRRADGTPFQSPDPAQARERMIPPTVLQAAATVLVEDKYGKPDIPEWVHVWKWARDMGARRPFPQQATTLSPAEREHILSDEEYADIQRRWVAAGSPRSSNPVAAVLR